MNLLLVHNVISLEVNIELLLGGVVSFLGFFGKSSGLSSFLLLLKSILLSMVVDWDLILESVLELLGGDLVGSGKEIFDFCA